MAQRLTPYFFILPAVFVIFIVTIYPMLFSLYLSFTNYNPNIGVNEFVGFENYLRIVADPEFFNAACFTAFFTSVGVTIEFLLGFGIALLLNSNLRAASIFRLLILIPLMVSEIVTGVIFMLMYQPGMGIIDYLLSSIGFKNILWLSDPNLARWAVVIADIWNWTPFMTLVLLAGLQSLPTEPFEAALIDGASKLRTFIHITLPLMRNVILVALLMRLIFSLKTFGLIMGLTAGGPGVATRNLSLVIYLQAIRFGNMGYASALSWIFIIIVMILGTLLVRVLTRMGEST